MVADEPDPRGPARHGAGPADAGGRGAPRRTSPPSTVASAAAGRAGFELREVGGGWRIYSAPAYADVVGRFVTDGQSARLTQAALETLAVIAYRQPVTRGQVSAVRGVNVDGVVRTLAGPGLVAETGTDPASGAVLYGTTGYFMERMGLGSLDDLPAARPLPSRHGLLRRGRRRSRGSPVSTGSGSDRPARGQRGTGRPSAGSGGRRAGGPSSGRASRRLPSGGRSGGGGYGGSRPAGRARGVGRRSAGGLRRRVRRAAGARTRPARVAAGRRLRGPAAPRSGAPRSGGQRSDAPRSGGPRSDAPRSGARPRRRRRAAVRRARAPDGRARSGRPLGRRPGAARCPPPRTCPTSTSRTASACRRCSRPPVSGRAARARTSSPPAA